MFQHRSMARDGSRGELWEALIDRIGRAQRGRRRERKREREWKEERDAEVT